jgi:nitroimidazol reductase NimA-like FMN-containing flavoprotein (pyridoxamine 5'-phosphate oxidase superfamily)
MNGREPVSVHPVNAGDEKVMPWVEASQLLAQAEFYWLATVRADGRPHVMPILTVWQEGALHFCTSARSRKGKNLARASHCVITTASHNAHLVVEGNAEKVSDEARLQQVADAYATKYAWHVAIRDGAFHADGAPTAGPPPYEVYAVVPTVAFGFGDGTFSPTRWRF